MLEADWELVAGDKFSFDQPFIQFNVTKKIYAES